MRRLGTFESYVLMAVRKLGDDAYGTPILRELGSLSNRETSLSATYTTLNRLVAKGYLAAALGEATAERGGRAKKFFTLTQVGDRVLTERLSELKHLALTSKELGWEGA